jgi:anti-sigma B factor antagonist
MIELETRQAGDLVILAASGSLQSGDNRLFAEKLKELASAGARAVAIDTSGLEYINSQAIADLIIFHNRMHDSGGRLAIAGMAPIVEKVVRAVGLGELITIFSTLEEAEAAWG